MSDRKCLDPRCIGCYPENYDEDLKYIGPRDKK